jgi:hypothetical protein
MNQTMKRLLNGWTGAALTLVMVGCGGASRVDVQSVGPQGATFAVAGSALRIEIPAGAVQRETELRFREVEPRQGEVRAFQVEPELDSAAAIRVTVKLDDAMGQGKHHLVEVENEVEHGVEVEVEDAAEHQLSGEVHHLGHLGVKRADDGPAHDAGAPAPTAADDKGTI